LYQRSPYAPSRRFATMPFQVSLAREAEELDAGPLDVIRV